MRLDEFLQKNAEKQTFRKDELIFEEGREADAAYYIISGEVEIFKGLPGKEPIMAMLEPGEIFGEMALLRYDSYTLSARAASNLELYVITPEILQEQVRNTHPLIKAILDMLVERVNTVNEVLIDLEQIPNKA